MWAGEVMQRIKLAYRYKVQDNRDHHRLLAYVNYNTMMSQVGDKMPTFLNYLRQQALTDEVRQTATEIEAEKARMLADIDAVVACHLDASGQRELTDEERNILIEDRRNRQKEREAQHGDRRIQDSRGGRGRSGPGPAFPHSLPADGGSHSKQCQGEFSRA